MLRNLQSRLTEQFILTADAEKRGFSDAIWGMLDTEMLRDEHCFTIGVENETTGLPTYRL